MLTLFQNGSTLVTFVYAGRYLDSITENKTHRLNSLYHCTCHQMKSWWFCFAFILRPERHGGVRDIYGYQVPCRRYTLSLLRVVSDGGMVVAALFQLRENIQECTNVVHLVLRIEKLGLLFTLTTLAG